MYNRAIVAAAAVAAVYAIAIVMAVSPFPIVSNFFCVCLQSMESIGQQCHQFITYRVRHRRRQRVHFQLALLVDAVEILVHQGVRLVLHQVRSVHHYRRPAAAVVMMVEAAGEVDEVEVPQKSRQREHSDDVEAGVVDRADAIQSEGEGGLQVLHRMQQNQLRTLGRNRD